MARKGMPGQESLRRERRLQRHREGRCMDCGTMDAGTLAGGNVCLACRMRHQVVEPTVYGPVPLTREKATGLQPGQKAEPGRRQPPRVSRYQARKAIGLCVRCGKPVDVAGRSYCKICLAKVRQTIDPARQRAAEKARRERYKAEGRCIVCGRQPAREGRTTCAACEERRRLKQLAAKTK